MLYNFPILQQNFKKGISIESWGPKDHIKLIPMLGNSLNMVPLAVPTHLLSLKFQSEVGNSNSTNVGGEAAWDIGHRSHGRCPPLPLLCIDGGCNGRQHRDPVRGVPPLGERDLVAVCLLLSAVCLRLQLDYPCECSLNAINATRINCDGAVFAVFPLLPYRQVCHSQTETKASQKTSPRFC